MVGSFSLEIFQLIVEEGTVALDSLHFAAPQELTAPGDDLPHPPASPERTNWGTGAPVGGRPTTCDVILPDTANLNLIKSLHQMPIYRTYREHRCSHTPPRGQIQQDTDWASSQDKYKVETWSREPKRCKWLLHPLQCVDLIETRFKCWWLPTMVWFIYVTKYAIT